MEGMSRFLKKFLSLAAEKRKPSSSAKDRHLLSKMHKTIKEVTEAMEELRMNLAVIKITEFVNYIIRYNDYISEKAFKEAIKNACLMLGPFAPHVCEEAWSRFGKGLVAQADWPKPDTEYIKPKYAAEEKLIAQVTADVEHIQKISGITTPAKISLFISEPWKYKVYNLVLEGKQIKEIMAEPKMKELGNAAAQYFQKLMKKKPLEELFLTAGSELETLKEAKEFLEKEFSCKVEITEAVKAANPKAKSAEPGKPGIIIE
jgi:leucyl-tRNA synthetase